MGLLRSLKPTIDQRATLDLPGINPNWLNIVEFPPNEFIKQDDSNSCGYWTIQYAALALYSFLSQGFHQMLTQGFNDAALRQMKQRIIDLLQAVLEGYLPTFKPLP